MMGIIAVVALIAYVLGFISFFATRVGVALLKEELQNLNENGEYIK